MCHAGFKIVLMMRAMSLKRLRPNLNNLNHNSARDLDVNMTLVKSFSFPVNNEDHSFTVTQNGREFTYWIGFFHWLVNLQHLALRISG